MELSRSIREWNLRRRFADCVFARTLMPHALIVDDDPTSRSALAELIDEIAEGRETATPQDFATRRYFSRHTQFAAEGLIDWRRIITCRLQ